MIHPRIHKSAQTRRALALAVSLGWLASAGAAALRAHGAIVPQ